MRHALAVSRLGAALVLLACLAAGCGGKSASSNAPPASWASVLRAAGQPTGSYVKATLAEAGGKTATVSTEWVSFDLATKVIDRRLGIGDDPTTAKHEVPGTREQPSLRFVLLADHFLMWNPGATATCGTPWINMPLATIEATTGVSTADLFVVEPARILRQARGKPSLVESTDAATVYDLPVDASVGLAGSSFLRSKPEVIKRLRNETNTARVSVARKGGAIEISVDLAKALKALGGDQGSGSATITWSLVTPGASLAAPKPAKVAKLSCLK